MHWLEKIYLNLHKKVYNNRLTKQKVFKNKYIISVGNLSVGGVGKTPLVALIANKLYSKYKVLIILRGYKSKSSNKCLLLDSDNNYTANIVGDESLLLSKITKAKVAISKNRELALKNCGDDVKYVLLDDAFQNPSIYQNHKIVIIDSNRFNDKNYSKLLPIGKMREPLSALTRADTVLISRCELIDKKKLKEISKEVLKYIISENLYFSETIFINTYKINLQNYQKKQKLQLSEIEKLILSKEKFGAFCGIANSEQFFINIEKQNIMYYQVAFHFQIIIFIL